MLDPASVRCDENSIDDGLAVFSIAVSCKACGESAVVHVTYASLLWDE